MLGQFQQYPIIPKHIWESHTGNKGNDLKTFPNNAPIVGAGPFTLKEFKKDQIALFQRYDGFYGPKPKVDAFGLRMFSNDDALVAALKAHEIDAIEEVPPTAIDTLKKAGFDVNDVPGTDQTDFIINSSPNKKSHPELQNLQVRTAFDNAIDRKRIVDVVFLGTAKPAGSIIPSATGDWANPSVQPTAFNIDKANSILDGLGYKKGGDGIRVANGQKMSYEVITPTDLSSANRDVRDPAAGLQEDRRPADAEGARLVGRLRRDDRSGRQVRELRPRALGLDRADRPRLHALGRHLRPVERLERHRLLRQEVRRDVLEAAADAQPGPAPRRRLEGADVPCRRRSPTSGWPRSTTWAPCRRSGRISSTRRRGRSTRCRS